MNPLARKALLFALFSLLLGGETAYFGRECAAAVLRQRGERAFFRNDHRASWGHYRAALAWGGDPERLRTDLVELLLFGLDQSEAGIRTNLQVPTERAVSEARDLIAPCLIAAPYKAYYWSLASDIYLHEAERLRRERPIDLQAPSEDPLENLTPPQWLAVAALETAATLERAVAAYPTLDSHSYLSRPDLPPEVLEAAVHGFEDVRGEVLMVPPALIEIDAARLLVAQDERECAVEFQKKAVAIDPGSYDARFLLGLLALNPGASGYREQCASLAPGTAR
jgi:tetratricopeptide (TPR) repeat protein